jgi:hypothetical protein
MYADFPGGEADLQFLNDESWLMNSAVNALVIYKNGEWQCWLVMAFVQYPYRFICRFINTNIYEQKAGLYADLYVRTARRDERGTLKINYDDFNICSN